MAERNMERRNQSLVNVSLLGKIGGCFENMKEGNYLMLTSMASLG